MSDNNEFKYGIKKEIIQRRIDEYNAILLNYAFLEDNMQSENDQEYIRIRDVIDELKAIIKNSSEEYSFVEIEQIEERLEFYKNALKNVDISDLQNYATNLEVELQEDRERLNKSQIELEVLRKEINDKKEEISKEDEPKKKLAQEENISIIRIVPNDKAERIKYLKTAINTRKAMIIARGDKLHINRFKELEKWEEELESLLNEKDESMAKDQQNLGTQKGKKQKSTNIEKESELKEKVKAIQELEEKIKKLEDEIAEKEKKLSSVKDTIKEKIASNKKFQEEYVKHNIEEFGQLLDFKELFKINEKSEIEIEYPPIIPEIDEEAIKQEYEMRKKDMLDKFYGNRKKGKEYKKRLYRFEGHVVEKEFEFIDKNGEKQKGIYRTVENYKEIQEDINFLQMDEAIERLERLSKAEAGDVSGYKEFKDIDQAMDIDDEYLVTNNYAYNRLMSTSNSLLTLGKYGEKVSYNQMQKGQPVKNALRVFTNIFKFLRNHITAPINKFIGEKYIVPIYNKITNPKKRVAGLYANKLSHRYVARRDYFVSQGKGYFASRWNSIFHAKEGNKAVLSAGAYDIKESIVRKYTDIAEKETVRKQTEFMSKTLDEKIEMIKKDLDKASAENKKRLELTLKDLEIAKEKVLKQRSDNEERKINPTIQTDAIDLNQHNVANIENVTRTITGVKMIGRLGLKRFIGPKIKEFCQDIERQFKVMEMNKKSYEPISVSKLPGGSGKLENIVSSSSGRKVRTYGEPSIANAGMHLHMNDLTSDSTTLTGNEVITGIFKDGADEIYGIDEITRIIRVKEYIKDLNKPVEKGIPSIEKILDELFTPYGKGNINSRKLSEVYIHMDDKYWVNLAELCNIERTDAAYMGKLQSKVGKVLDDVDRAYTSVDVTTDIYENVRKSNSRPRERHYEQSSEFTGKRKDIAKNIKSNKDINER